mmetsp:Transcript_14074/g.28974  ORF Transcript_14074/g.28974 Transcript_14074/m.28974 type:complete len:374 (-) Transcript_14074:416-1537(-)
MRFSTRVNPHSSVRVVYSHPSKLRIVKVNETTTSAYVMCICVVSHARIKCLHHIHQKQLKPLPLLQKFCEHIRCLLEIPPPLSIPRKADVLLSATCFGSIDDEFLEMSKNVPNPPSSLLRLLLLLLLLQKLIIGDVKSCCCCCSVKYGNAVVRDDGGTFISLPLLPPSAFRLVKDAMLLLLPSNSCFLEVLIIRVRASRKAIRTLERAISLLVSTQHKPSVSTNSSFKKRAPYSLFSIRTISQVSLVASFLLLVLMYSARLALITFRNTVFPGCFMTICPLPNKMSEWRGHSMMRLRRAAPTPLLTSLARHHSIHFLWFVSTRSPVAMLMGKFMVGIPKDWSVYMHSTGEHGCTRTRRRIVPERVLNIMLIIP